MILNKFKNIYIWEIYIILNIYFNIKKFLKKIKIFK